MLNIDEQYYGQAERGVKRLSLEKLVAFCSQFQLTLDDIIQIHDETENRALKKMYIEEITQLLENCSSDQLALIQSLVRNSLPQEKPPLKMTVHSQIQRRFVLFS